MSPERAACPSAPSGARDRRSQSVPFPPCSQLQLPATSSRPLFLVCSGPCTAASARSPRSAPGRMLRLQTRHNTRLISEAASLPALLRLAPLARTSALLTACRLSCCIPRLPVIRSRVRLGPAGGLQAVMCWSRRRLCAPGSCRGWPLGLVRRSVGRYKTSAPAVNGCPLPNLISCPYSFSFSPFRA